MSLSVDVIEDAELPADPPSERRIDVTNLEATAVQTYVDECISTDAVSLEHRGHRTFLRIESGHSTA